ncbi:MAG: TonB family protein, partial [Flavobacteriales bacterium]
FYADGKMKFHGQLAKYAISLDLFGQCVEYYPKGNKKLVVNYDAPRKKTGYEYCFYPNGKLHTEQYYDFEIADWRASYLTCKDSLGNILAEHGNGRWVEYNDDFTKEISSGPVRNKKQEGDWTVWTSDTTKTIITYQDALIVSEMPYNKVEGKFLSMDEIPMYRGSFKALKDYITKNARYPQKARNHQISGKVIVAVIVKPDGELLAVDLVKGIGYGCDEAALKVIRETGPWQANTTLKTPLIRSKLQKV